MIEQQLIDKYGLTIERRPLPLEETDGDWAANYIITNKQGCSISIELSEERSAKFESEQNCCWTFEEIIQIIGYNIQSALSKDPDWTQEDAEDCDFDANEEETHRLWKALDRILLKQIRLNFSQEFIDDMVLFNKATAERLQKKWKERNK